MQKVSLRENEEQAFLQILFKSLLMAKQALQFPEAPKRRLMFSLN